MAEDRNEGLNRRFITPGQLKAYEKPEAVHTKKLQGKLVAFETERLGYEKIVADTSADASDREKALNQKVEVSEKIVKAHEGMSLAMEKDEVAAREHYAKYLDACEAQNQGMDLGTEVYDKETLEMIKFENSVDMDEVFQTACVGGDPIGVHADLTELYREKFHMGTNKFYGEADTNWHSGVTSRNMIPLALLATEEERAKILRETTPLAFATSQASFTPEQAGNMRQKAIIGRLFNRDVIEFCGPDVRSVMSGRVNLIVARGTTPANSAPTAVAEASATTPYALNFFSKQMTLKRIQGIMRWTDETELLVPGTAAQIRRDLRMALREQLQRYWLYGNDPDNHEGLFRAAATTTVNGQAARAAGDRIGSTGEIDISGASNISDATQLATAAVVGGGATRAVDYVHALTRKDLYLLLPGEVCNIFQGIQSGSTDADAEGVLMDKVGGVLGTALIPDAVASAPTTGFTLLNGAGFHEDDRTYGYAFRGRDRAATGDISIFPGVELLMNNFPDMDKAIRQLHARMFVSIYACPRPQSAFKYVLKTL